MSYVLPWFFLSWKHFEGSMSAGVWRESNCSPGNAVCSAFIMVEPRHAVWKISLYSAVADGEPTLIWPVLHCRQPRRFFEWLVASALVALWKGSTKVLRMIDDVGLKVIPIWLDWLRKNFRSPLSSGWYFVHLEFPKVLRAKWKEYLLALSVIFGWETRSNASRVNRIDYFAYCRTTPYFNCQRNQNAYCKDYYYKGREFLWCSSFHVSMSL